MDFHRQCKVTRKVGEATEVVVTWLPEYFAKVGEVIDLDSHEGKREKGWAVSEVYDRRPSKEVAERERDYKKNREASDV